MMWRRRRRYHVVRQYDTSDCGPAALLTVLRYWGGNASVPYVRDLARTDGGGSTLHALARAAGRLGLEAEGAAGNYDQLLEQRFPVIAHVVRENGLLHYVVLFEANGTRVVMGDPARGLRVMPREEFERMWATGVVMLIEPTDTLHDAAPPHWFTWLRGYGARDSTWFVQVALLGIGYAGLGLLTAVFVQVLLDRLIPARNVSRVALAGGALLALQAARAALGYLRAWFVLEVQYRVGVRITADFITHVFSLPPQFFATRRKGDLTSRIHDAMRIQQALLLICGQTVVDVLVIVASAVGLWVVTGWPALAVVAVLPLFAGALMLSGRALTERQRDAMQAYASFESTYINALSGIDEVRTFGGAAAFSSRAATAAGVFQQASRALGRSEARLSLLAELAGGALTVISLAWGGALVIQQHLAIGQLMAGYALIAAMLPACLRLVAASISLRGASVAATRLFDLLLVDREESRRDPALAFTQAIEIRDVTFAWPDGTVLLDEASLTIRAGELTALLGPSGSGKSTIVRVLQRKLAIDRGWVLVDGIPLDEFPLEAVRRGIAVAPQVVPIFNGTLADNLLVGRAGWGLEDLRAFVARSGLGPLMRRFPGGLATPLGEDARQLSAGERQTVGLLRALLDEPPLLVVDEGISAIDVRGAALVLDTLEAYARGHAVLVISHDPAMTGRADRVFALERGRIVPATGASMTPAA